MCSKGGKPTYRAIVANTSFDARTEYTLSGNGRWLRMIFLPPSSKRLYLQRTLDRSSYPGHGLSVWGSHVA
jgi:hypothetical protein